MGNKNKFAIMALVLAISAGLVTGASYRPLPEQTKAALGATHVLVLKYSDLTNTVATGPDTYTSVSIPTKHGIECVAAVLKTPFYGGSTNITSTKIKVGDSTSATLFLDEMEVQANAVEEFFKWGNRSFNSASTSILPWTNATAATAITPLAPGAVTPTITLTPSYQTITDKGDIVVAVITGMTATSSALPDFVTNATAATTLTPATGSALGSYTVTQGQNVYTSSVPLKVTVTPAGISGNSTLTAGEIWIYMKDLDQPSFGN
jgi:hypothetical protein